MHENQHKRISVVGSAGVPARYGGFETLVEQLCINLNNQVDFLVFCSQKNYSRKESKTEWSYSKRKFLNLSANGVSSIIYDLTSILLAAKHSNKILVLGSSAGFFLPIFRVIYPKIILFYHPDGLEWKRSKWNFLIKSFLYISNSLACMAANQLIIDNNELKGIYKRYKNKTSTITYGGDQYISKSPNEIKQEWLLIARACPENQIDTICEAFSQLPNEKLILITEVESTFYGRKIFNKYKYCTNIVFKGAIYEKDRLSQFLNNCKGYIHPHTVGGTNPSLTAAMWHKMPILCFDNQFNRETTGNTCVYFKDLESLKSLIQNPNLSTNPKTYEKAVKDYSWKTIAEKYKLLFKTT